MSLTTNQLNSLIHAIGRLQDAISTGGYVPYTGATANVNLGTFTLTTPQINGVNGALLFTNVAQSSGAITNFTYTHANHTGQTASIAIPKVLHTLGSTQFLTGGIAVTQGFYDISQPTISFVGSSTAALTATVRIAAAPNSGANAIQTATVGLLVESMAVNGTGTATSSYGILCVAQSGASTNWAASFLGGNVEISSGASAVRGLVVRNTTNNASAFSAIQFTNNATITLGSAFVGVSSGTASGTITANTLLMYNQRPIQLYVDANQPISFLTTALLRWQITGGGVLTASEGMNIATGTTTGSLIGVTSSQKLGFWGVGPIVQPVNTVAIDTVLVNTGLMASGATTTTIAQNLLVTSGKNFTLGNAAVTGLVAGALAALTTASLVIYDSAGQAYRVPCVI